MSPAKVVFKLIYNTLLGCMALITINIIGNLFGFEIAFNFFTAFIVGSLGIPGVVLVIVLQAMFK
ncbi:MAG: pro-sigmaK processing inhibitor BofA family protein [Clostridia bacterium]|nr:pro-sigmaK processing inhibitor BofA family protein [Clostridia bacterium]